MTRVITTDGAHDLAAIWAGTVNMTNPAYAAQLAALESYVMAAFITP